MSVVLEDKPRSATSSKCSELTQLIRQYGCGPIQLTGTNDERHLIFDNVMDAAAKWRRLRYDTQPTFFL
jgi:starch phosphorylase